MQNNNWQKNIKRRKVKMLRKIMYYCALTVLWMGPVLAQEAKPNPLECDESGVIRQGRYIFSCGTLTLDNVTLFDGMNLWCMAQNSGGAVSGLGLRNVDERVRNRTGESITARWHLGYRWEASQGQMTSVSSTNKYVERTTIEGNRIRRDVGHRGAWPKAPEKFQYDVLLHKRCYGKVSAAIIDGKRVELPEEPGAEVLAENVRKIQVNPDDPERNLTFESPQGMRILDMRKTWAPGNFKIEILLDGAAKQSDATLYITLPDAARTGLPEPAVRLSQIGYPANGPKYVVLEHAVNAERPHDDSVSLERREDGKISEVRAGAWAGDSLDRTWGPSLHHHAYMHAMFDFSGITEPGEYRITWSGGSTKWFEIKSSIFDDRTWTGALDYFLPWEMCHMELYNGPDCPVRHRPRCHPGEAHLVRAPEGVKPDEILKVVTGKEWYAPFAKNKEYPIIWKPSRGAWHDCGDYLKRMNMVKIIVYNLAVAYDEFKIDRDFSSYDVEKQVFRYGRPDGMPDVLQQLEWGIIFMCEMTWDDGTIGGGYYGGHPYTSTERAGHGGISLVHQMNALISLFASYKQLLPVRPELAERALAAAKRGLARLEKVPYPPADKEIGMDGTPGSTMEYDGSMMSVYAEAYLATEDPKYLRKLLDNPQWLSNLKPYLHKHSQYDVPIIPMARLYSKLDAKEHREYRQVIKDACRRLALGDRNAGYSNRERLWPTGSAQGLPWKVIDMYWLAKVVPELVNVADALPAMYYLYGLHPASDMVFVTGVPGTRSTTALFSGLLAIHREDFDKDWLAKWRKVNPIASFVPGATVGGFDFGNPGGPLIYVEDSSAWIPNEAMSASPAMLIHAVHCLKRAGF
jgi:hypothetical protein